MYPLSVLAKKIFLEEDRVKSWSKELAIFLLIRALERSEDPYET